MLIPFLGFILSAQLILFLGHFLVYKALVSFLEISNQAILSPLKIILVILSLSFFVSSFLAYKYSGFWVRWFYSFSAVWLGFFYFLIWASILSWILIGFSSLILSDMSPQIIAVPLFALALVIAVFSMLNSFYLRTTRVSVAIPNLPDIWRGKKIVWVSDLHLGNIYNSGFAKKVSEKISSLNPETVFIGGDFFDGSLVNLDELAKNFSENLNPSGGIYFVSGNHEEFGDKNTFLDPIRKTKIKILENEKVNLNGLWLIGVDWRDSEKEGDFQKILSGLDIDGNNPSILLKHSPSHWKVSQEAGIDFQISGHTHRGQLFPFGFITKSVYKGYDYGLKKFKDMFIYTSSGVGTWGPPLRFFTKPEVVLITLE